MDKHEAIVDNSETKLDPSTVEAQHEPSQSMYETAEQGKSIEEKTPNYNDLIIDKYKNKEDPIYEQLKGYSELHREFSKLSANLSPESYTLPDLTNKGFQFDEENPVLKSFKNFAKENKISQEVFNGLLDIYVDLELGKMPNRENEYKQLGPDAQDKVNRLDKWLSESLPSDLYNEAKPLLSKASYVKAFDSLRDQILNSDRTIPDENQRKQYVAPQLTKQQISNEIISNYEKFKSDPNYRDEMRRKLESAL